MSLVVRVPRANDARAIAALRNAAWRDTYVGLVDQALLDGLDDERSAQVWEGRIAALNGRGVDHNGATLRVTVDVDTDTIVGMAEMVATPQSDAPAPQEVRIFNMHPDWTRQGVGNRMLGALTAAGDCSAWVVRGNKKAIAFFTKRGFALTGRERVEAKFGVPEVELVRTGWVAPGF